MVEPRVDNIIKGDFYCPRCGELMREKRPKNDKFLIRHREKTVRLSCLCGYYQDRIVSKEDFLD
jgi:hypothetical protein